MRRIVLLGRGRVGCGEPGENRTGNGEGEEEREEVGLRPEQPRPGDDEGEGGGREPEHCGGDGPRDEALSEGLHNRRPLRRPGQAERRNVAV
jgi:hypothetical protein